jgi:hypothetical protein
MSRHEKFAFGGVLDPRNEKAMTDQEAKELLVLMVAPWLPHAEIAELEIQEECGCYSEWTQEPPFFHVTFSAPRAETESDRDVSRLVSVVESVIGPWAQRAYTWKGCESCGEPGKPRDYPGFYVRIIPIRKRVESSTP